MTKIETLQKQLEEAEQAYHELMIGARTVSVNVEGVGSTSYAQADSSKLREYISYLKAEIGKANGLKNRKVIKVSFWFIIYKEVRFYNLSKLEEAERLDAYKDNSYMIKAIKNFLKAYEEATK